MSMTTTHVRFEKSYISWKSSTTKTTTQVELKKHSNLNSNAISTSWRTNFTEKYLGPVNNFKTCNLQQLDSLHRQEHLDVTHRTKSLLKQHFFLTFSATVISPQSVMRNYTSWRRVGLDKPERTDEPPAEWDVTPQLPIRTWWGSGRRNCHLQASPASQAADLN